MKYLSVEGLVALAWTTTASALLFTLGRFAIRCRNRKRLGWDDILNGVAAIFLIGFTSTWQVSAPVEYQAQLYKLGIADSEPIIHRELFMRYNLANGLLFWCCLYSVKGSFLALYWYIFEVSNKFRIAWVLATTYTVLGFAITIVFRLIVCGHPRDVLNAEKCRNIGKTGVMKMQVTWGVLDGLGDIILMLLPIAMIRKMFLRRRQKVQLSILFGLVGLNLATNVLRTVYTINRDLKRFPQLNCAWIFLQISTAVIICSLPCYGSLFTQKNKPTTPDIVTYGSASGKSKDSGSFGYSKNKSHVDIDSTRSY